jgi:DNA invertase Pin-like site-specific DNA recombinase
LKRAVLYLRVSTLDQTTANQERELREVAGRMGCEIVHVYKDHGSAAPMGDLRRNPIALSTARARPHKDSLINPMALSASAAHLVGNPGQSCDRIAR